MYLRLGICALLLIAGLVAVSDVAAENTSRPNIVLMMSDDQGWGETSYNGHPYGVIEWPRVITSPRVSSVPCVTSDILPTLIDIVGVPYPKPDRPLDGISLKELIVDGTMDRCPSPIGFWTYNKKPELENEPWLEDTTLNEWITLDAKKAKSKNSGPPLFTNHKHPRIVPENFQTSAAWMTERYKLIIPRPKGGETPAAELYDIQKDRGEQNDIASEYPEIVKAMRSELRKWQKSVERSLTGADYY